MDISMILLFSFRKISLEIKIVSYIYIMSSKIQTLHLLIILKQQQKQSFLTKLTWNVCFEMRPLQFYSEQKKSYDQ